MVRLNLLGAIHLVDGEGRPCNADLGGNKNLALLAYLIMAGANRPVRRDTVVGLFWPESDQKNARQSLNQALYKLRTAFPSLVASQGHEELFIDSHGVDCDCFEFASHAAAGKLEDAVRLYRGDFAAGLYVKESPEFDEWLSHERTVWRGHLTDVLKELVDDALDGNDLNAAAVWAEKRFDLAPHEQEALQDLLSTLIERGNHAAAIRLYEHYRRVMHEKFDLEPAADISALIDAIPKAQHDGVKRASLYIGQLSYRPRRVSVKWVGIAAGVIALFAVAFSRYQFRTSLAQGTVISPTAAPRVAVTRFAYTGSAERSARVLNDALQWRLQAAGFDVIDAGQQDTAALRNVAVGSEGLTFVIGGDVEPLADSSLVARLWLKDAASGKRIWASEFTEKMPDAHVIATQFSEAITTQIRKAAGLASDIGSSLGEVPANSWSDLYHVRERMESAMDMQRAGSVAGSRVELSDADATLLDLSRRNPDWSLPWLLRARIAEAQGSTELLAGNAKSARIELDRGISLLDSVPTQSRTAQILGMRGKLQYRKWVYGIDDVAEASGALAGAERDLREALRLGRERSDSYVALSGVMFAQGKYVESYVFARRAYDGNIFMRHNQEILNRLFNSALHSGDDVAANQWCQELQMQDPGTWPTLACRINLAGFAPQLVPLEGLDAAINRFQAPAPIRQLIEPRLKASYAVSLAQLGMNDSARATLRAIGSTGQDPELTLLSAFTLAALKDAPQAHAMLRSYLSEATGTRSNVLNMRWLH